MTSPLLKDLIKKTGISEAELLPMWKRTLEEVARKHDRLFEDLTADDYVEASEILETSVSQEMERRMEELDPDNFLESSLDAKSYLETVFVQDSPEGEEETDDDETHLIPSGEGQALQAAGLMAPGGAMGESFEDGMLADASDENETTEEDTDSPVVSLDNNDDIIADLAKKAAEEVLRRSPR